MSQTEQRTLTPETPEVSVIIPVYNEEAGLGALFARLKEVNGTSAVIDPDAESWVITDHAIDQYCRRVIGAGEVKMKTIVTAQRQMIEALEERCTEVGIPLHHEAIALLKHDSKVRRLYDEQREVLYVADEDENTVVTCYPYPKRKFDELPRKLRAPRTPKRLGRH